MKKTFVLFPGVSAIVLALASAVSTFGQEKPVIVEKETTFQTALPLPVTIPGQEPGSGPITMNNFTFVSSEFSFDRLVKGAPYSAQAVTESTQTLADGNRIVNTSTATVYRDGEGRTRREQTLRSIGPFSPSGEPMKTISISDPNAGVGYMLDPANRVAHKNQAYHMEPGGVGGVRARRGGGTGESEGVGEGVGSGGVGVAFTLSKTPNGEVQMGGRGGGGEVKMRTRSEKGGPDVRMEGLGTQTIEGVNAVGSRTTVTIPSGQIGNERPIEIIEERWFSEELQTVVMTRHSDPRAGETVYRLTNIIRAEPDRSLFEVPSDYTIKEEQPMRFEFKTKKPGNPEQQ